MSSIPLDRYPSGTYFVTLSSPDASTTLRLVID